jgi:transcription elongation factor Elf1
MNLKDAGHLFRMAFLFVIGLLLFLVLRTVLVPRSFGQYGHYRGDAIGEIKAKPVNYAGHQTCETCHSDVLEVKKKGKHVHVACESCHGPLAKHADDPTSVHPERLNTAVLCVRCHEANASKPKKFPQVVSADHSAGLACHECHKPHSPVIETEVKATPGKADMKSTGGKK